MTKVIRVVFATLLICMLFNGANCLAEDINEWTKAAILLPEEAPAAPVKIAIIDTGINTDRIDGELVAEGKNYALADDGTEDLVGHGTFVAGLIVGAEYGDGTLHGIAPSSLLTPLVFYSKLASGATQNGGMKSLCAAIYDAVDMYGCKVINISAGAIEPDDRLLAATLYAEQHGVIVVAAVGNDNIVAPERVYYPAAYDTVVGVGAVDSHLNVLPKSQRNNSVFVCAPGADIYSVSIKSEDSYERIAGTSYAAAYVSGMAALLLSLHPDMTPAIFRWVLQNTSKDIGAPGYDTSYGYGIIQISEAVENYSELIKGGALPFRDVMNVDSHTEAVKFLYSTGVLSGVSSTRFAPNERLTRAMFTTMLWRMASAPLADELGIDPANLHPFSDVGEGEWYSDAVTWAAANGIVRGIGSDLFAPNAQISRQDMAVIYYRFCMWKGIDVSAWKDTDIFDGGDGIRNVSEYAIPAMRWAAYGMDTADAAAGISAFADSKTPMSRSETAVMLHRLIMRDMVKPVTDV